MKEKLDITKYKEEDITNISKEETPIVKQLQAEQTKYFILGFLSFVAFFSFGFMGKGVVPQVVLWIVGILLAAFFIFCVVKSMRVSKTKDKIMKWQKESLYAKYRTPEE